MGYCVHIQLIARQSSCDDALLNRLFCTDYCRAVWWRSSTSEWCFPVQIVSLQNGGRQSLHIRAIVHRSLQDRAVSIKLRSVLLSCTEYCMSRLLRLCIVQWAIGYSSCTIERLRSRTAEWCFRVFTDHRTAPICSTFVTDHFFFLLHLLHIDCNKKFLLLRFGPPA